jgi:hypothetical protein
MERVFVNFAISILAFLEIICPRTQLFFSLKYGSFRRIYSSLVAELYSRLIVQAQLKLYSLVLIWEHTFLSFFANPA